MPHIHLEPLYQTVQGRGTPQLIENMGPIYGLNNTWLGKGYYFWEGAIELAHWWGNVHCRRNYYICEATADFEKKEMLDLFGDTGDLRNFRIILDALSKTHFFEEITVSAVLEQMRKHGDLNCKVIRARSEHHIPGSLELKFVENDKGYMVTLPVVQVCITDLNMISNFHVIFSTREELGPYV